MGRNFGTNGIPIQVPGTTRASRSGERITGKSPHISTHTETLMLVNGPHAALDNILAYG